MLNELLAVAGGLVLLAGVVVCGAGAYKAAAHFLWWAQQWNLRRAGRKQYAAAGWNTNIQDIPEGKKIVAIWEGWRPEVCIRKKNWLYSEGVSFSLDSCVGWADIPPC
jgi:hypothetical protein